VVDRHDEVETLLEHDAVAIHIKRIKEVPRDSDTLVHQQIAEELGREPCGVRFLLTHQYTAARVMPLVMVAAPRAPCHGSGKHEAADEAYPPPASACHGCSSCWLVASTSKHFPMRHTPLDLMASVTCVGWAFYHGREGEQ
jgi:hypothetical protein